MGKQIIFNRESEMPDISVSSGDMEWNKTGSWRTQRPFYENKTAPCQTACPAGNDIASFILKIANRDFEGAWNLIREENPFPGICGRVCFHPCEPKCNRGSFDQPVAIHALERFVADAVSSRLHRIAGKTTRNGRPKKGKDRIAIIGSGPAGMSCAYHLAKLHYEVTVFESLPFAGGMLRMGIPPYRLPRDILDNELSAIQASGVEVRTGVAIGRQIKMEDLKDYQAIFIATGAHQSRRLNIAGETDGNVASGLELLGKVNLGKAFELGERVVIIGGGNTAIDVARSTIRLGKKPMVLYRRSREEMPAFDEEVLEAIEEGVEFTFLANPIGFLKEDGVKRLECLRMELGEKDETGRRRPVPVPNSNFFVAADSIVAAAGEEIEVSFIPQGIEQKEGILLTRAGGGTAMEGVFAGGDLASNSRTVAHAIGSGKKAAIAIDCYLRENDPEKAIQSLLIGNGPSVSVFPYFHPGENLRSSHIVTFEELNMDYFEIAEGVKIPKCSVPERIRGFREVTSVLSEEAAVEEAERCFNCGTCNECENCYTFCPDASILKETKRLSHQVNYDFCKGCGICFTECPRRAISLQEEAR